MPDTSISYPAGAVTGSARVRLVAPLADATVAVVTDATPFHPVDHTWPDQPADRGTLAGAALVDCRTGAIGADGTLFVGADIPVRRGEPGWDWVVVHVLPAAAAPAVGDEVALDVDAQWRTALSRGHTACHLAALALNTVAEPYWGKPVERRDSLGHPDLDALAITVSRVEPDGAFDAYRLGKGVRRKGLDTARVRAELVDLQVRADELLARWVTAGGAVHVDTGGDGTLSARRTWVALLPDGEGRIPCGGTHVTDVADLGAVTVSYTATDDGFEVRTAVGS